MDAPRDELFDDVEAWDALIAAQSPAPVSASPATAALSDSEAWDDVIDDVGVGERARTDSSTARRTGAPSEDRSGRVTTNDRMSLYYAGYLHFGVAATIFALALSAPRDTLGMLHDPVGSAVRLVESLALLVRLTTSGFFGG